MKNQTQQITTKPETENSTGSGNIKDNAIDKNIINNMENETTTDKNTGNKKPSVTTGDDNISQDKENIENKKEEQNANTTKSSNNIKIGV